MDHTNRLDAALATVNGSGSAHAATPNGIGCGLVQATGIPAAILGSKQPLTMTVRDMAAALQLSERTIKRLVSERAIPGVLKIGRAVRFDTRQIEAWVAEGCPRPTRRR